MNPPARAVDWTSDILSDSRLYNNKRLLSDRMPGDAAGLFLCLLYCLFVKKVGWFCGNGAVLYLGDFSGTETGFFGRGGE